MSAPTLSTGQPSTLGVYRDLTATAFGEDNYAIRFLDAKIEEQGRDEPVLVEALEMLSLIIGLVYGPEEDSD